MKLDFAKALLERLQFRVGIDSTAGHPARLVIKLALKTLSEADEAVQILDLDVPLPPPKRKPRTIDDMDKPKRKRKPRAKKSDG